MNELTPTILIAILISGVVLLGCGTQTEATVSTGEETPVITPTDENESVNILHAEHVAYIDPLESLQRFLLNDSTSENGYVPGEYTCMDFSISLANNLTIAGYDAGIVMTNQKNKPGHALVWVTMPKPYNLFYVEPMLDEIYNPDVYTNRTDDYTFRETSVDHAERCNNDMRRWGV